MQEGCRGSVKEINFKEVEDELFNIYTYNNIGAVIALGISLFLIAANRYFEQVNVDEMNRCQGILQKVFSTKYIFIVSFDT